VYVRLAPIHRSLRHIPATAIEDVTVTTYPPATYDGWHWGARRSLGGNTAYRLRGTHGVEVTLDDGRKIFLGSQSPADLARAIRQAIATD